MSEDTVKSSSRKPRKSPEEVFLELLKGPTAQEFLKLYGQRVSMEQLDQLIQRAQRENVNLSYHGVAIALQPYRPSELVGLSESRPVAYAYDCIRKAMDPSLAADARVKLLEGGIRAVKDGQDFLDGLMGTMQNLVQPLREQGASQPVPQADPAQKAG